MSTKWVLLTILVAWSAVTLGQREGPVLKPQKKSTPTIVSALIACDLACNWQLDGEQQGRLEAHVPAKRKLEVGQHLLSATTLDGQDTFQSVREVTAGRQVLITLELDPVREHRLQTEKEIEEKAKQEAAKRSREEQERAAQEQSQREEAARAAKEHEKDLQAEATGLVWIDPVTHLMWMKDQSKVELEWKHAFDFCHNLRLAGSSDWRLASIRELEGLYDPNVRLSNTGVPIIEYRHGHPVETGRVKWGQNVSWSWSDSPTTSEKEMWAMYFPSGKRYSLNASGYKKQALCVRSTGVKQSDELEGSAWDFTEDWVQDSVPKHWSGRFLFDNDGACDYSGQLPAQKCRWIKQGANVTITFEAIENYGCGEKWELTQDQRSMSGKRSFLGFYGCNIYPIQTLRFAVR